MKENSLIQNATFNTENYEKTILNQNKCSICSFYF